MITRILHISDLHFPSRDLTVTDCLGETIKSKHPDLIVVTGDISNQPSLRSLFGRGGWAEARAWLAGLTTATGKAPAMLVLPGNHDVLFWGLMTWCWPFLKMFNRVFGAWHKPGIHYLPQARVTFLTLDTNPWGARFSAEGKVLRSRIARLKRSLETHPNKAEIRASTKILLIHHHPLPVPFRGRDMLLHTRRVDRLLQFLAEQRIDLVLHGHRHHASWSLLRVGDTSSDITEPCFIETLGAGAAMKKDGDHDPRGHNFNLIDIAPNGVQQIRQFFKLPESAHFVEASHSAAEDKVNRLMQSHFRQPYRVRRLTWTLQVDLEAFADNTLQFEGLVFNRQMESYEIPLPEDEVEEGGRVLPYRDLRVTPQPGLTAALVPREIDGRARTVIKFTQQPIEQMRATVVVANYTQESYAMDQREAAALGRKNPTFDYVDFLLTDPAEELCFEATFPTGFEFRNPRLEVLEPLEELDVLHQRLTAGLSNTPRADGNVLKATIDHPPVNYRYRVCWDLPKGQGMSASARARCTDFEVAYLGLVADDRPPSPQVVSQLEAAVIGASLDLKSCLDRLIASAIHSTGSLALFADAEPDLSLMIRVGGSPALRLVYWSREDDFPLLFRDFRLGVGRGNAGRAYKTCSVRIFDKARADENPKANTFVDAGGPDYQAVLSLPLLDPRTQQPLGVLNVGVTTRLAADLLAALTETDLAELMTRVQGAPVTTLLGAAGLGV